MEPRSGINLKRGGLGGLTAFIGFMLSPLSWWNDLVVNVPLALATAWVVSLFWPAAFGAAFVVGYWLTNLAGLFLLQKGVGTVISGRSKPYSRRQLAKDVAISLGYTLLIVVLVKFRVLAPAPHYFGQRGPT